MTRENMFKYFEHKNRQEKSNVSIITLSFMKVMSSLNRKTYGVNKLLSTTQSYSMKSFE